jgi:hypothetical protein
LCLVDAELLGRELCGFDQLLPIGWPETDGILAPVPVRDLVRCRRRMPELTAPTVRLHATWLETRDEWGPGVHEDDAHLAAAADSRVPRRGR